MSIISILILFAGIDEATLERLLQDEDILERRLAHAIEELKYRQDKKNAIIEARKPNQSEFPSLKQGVSPPAKISSDQWLYLSPHRSTLPTPTPKTSAVPLPQNLADELTDIITASPGISLKQLKKLHKGFKSRFHSVYGKSKNQALYDVLSRHPKVVSIKVAKPVASSTMYLPGRFNYLLRCQHRSRYPH